MCGISIIISKQTATVPDGIIRRMTDAVQHRGPGGEGFYHYQQVALGHRRLAIIDLSEAGRQPMHWQDELSIVFNGEIYNYLELRQELAAAGYTFFSRTDTEVILAAYHYWGTACQHRFNGMWAFAILDKRNQLVFCSRDRFGVKPFYYAGEPGYFLAGSEIRQLLPEVADRQVCRPALADYLLLHLSDHTEDTFFNRIRQLRGGHQLVYRLQENRYTISRWYELQFREEISRLAEPDLLARFEAESRRSVRWRMRSDVRVGTCLSGGLDSSYIAALSAMQHREAGAAEGFHAITAGSVQPEADERYFAGLVARQYGLQWHTVVPDQAAFDQVIDQVIRLQEEPFEDLSVYMQYFVMQQARAAGITVLLDGQGADESLLGYSRYIFQPMQRQGLFQKLVQLPQIRSRYGLGLKETMLQAFYYNQPYLRWQQRRHRLRHLQSSVANACRKEGYLPSAGSFRELQQQEMISRHLPLLLRFEDKNAMHFSIETRLPFLDWQLVETVFSMNDAFRFKDGWSKYILRKANEKLLPAEITWRRKKLGFVAPVQQWMADPGRWKETIRQSPFLQELFNGRLPDLENARLRWKLYNLHCWAQHFEVYL